MSELLNALNPTASRKRTRDEYERQESPPPDAPYLRPLLVPRSLEYSQSSALEGAFIYAASQRQPASMPVPAFDPPTLSQSIENSTHREALNTARENYQSPYQYTSWSSELANALGPPRPSDLPVIVSHSQDIPTTQPDGDLGPDTFAPYTALGTSARNENLDPAVSYDLNAFSPGAFSEPIPESSPASIPETSAISSSEPEYGSDALVTTDQKRKNGKDKRILTIQAVMRKELRRAMRIGRHDALPPPYTPDDGPLNDYTPVRFDWDQTIGRSVHNRDMRSRVIAELQRRRRRYPDVPDTGFDDKKALETVFDTAYNSLRTKWKTQNESQSRATPAAKPTKPLKAGKVGTRQRRQARKKVRLQERKDARTILGNDAFADAGLDPALQIGCMSSDESVADMEVEPPDSSSDDEERDEVRSSTQPGLLSHPLPWRSRRLEQFYALLDEASLFRPNATANRARGATRRPRKRGPAKTATRNPYGLVLPPKGLPSWMISKNWRQGAEKRLKHTQGLLPQMLDEQDGVQLNEDALGILGSESELEDCAGVVPYIPHAAPKLPPFAGLIRLDG